MRRIQRAAEAGDAAVSVIDYAAAARQADLDLPATTLLLIGNPAVGTPLMEEARTAGIDLPLKMLVWEDRRGEARIAYNEPDFLAERHGITRQADRIDAIAATLRTLARG